jgi:hypothetical protein
MEIVAMDMKLRGIYIARQLSFHGVSFRIDEVELPPKLKKVYDDSVKFWVDLMHRYTLVDVWGAKKLVGENPKVDWAEFSTLR